MIKSNPDSTQQKNNLIALILKEMERQGKNEQIPTWLKGNGYGYTHNYIVKSLQCSLQIRNNKTEEIINVE